MRSGLREENKDYIGGKKEHIESQKKGKKRKRHTSIDKNSTHGHPCSTFHSVVCRPIHIIGALVDAIQSKLGLLMSSESSEPSSMSSEPSEPCQCHPSQASLVDAIQSKCAI
jgi:hypothetical protein